MTTVRRHPLTRRAFLGAAGGVVALTFLEQLATAGPGGTVKPPLRFGGNRVHSGRL